jgi:hypothetical protein
VPDAHAKMQFFLHQVNVAVHQQELDSHFRIFTSEFEHHWLQMHSAELDGRSDAQQPTRHPAAEVGFRVLDFRQYPPTALIELTSLDSQGNAARGALKQAHS